MTTSEQLQQQQQSQGRAFLEIDKAVKRFSQGRSSSWSRLFSQRRDGTKNRYVSAVDSVSLGVGRGETLVILGESGSGKTTLGRLVVGLERLDSGAIRLDGEEVRHVRDRGAKRGRLQMVFQDPGSSLDPYMTVASCVAEPLSRMGVRKQEARSRASAALELVGLEDPAFMNRPTSELSGGQKQRVAIARAIISEPAVVVLDEPTSSIDVSIQAQVLNLLVELQRVKGLTYVLITHDPNIARFMGDNVAVMHLGKVVEYGTASDVLENPWHPYTKALLASAPKIGDEVTHSDNVVVATPNA